MSERLSGCTPRLGSFRSRGIYMRAALSRGIFVPTPPLPPLFCRQGGTLFRAGGAFDGSIFCCAVGRMAHQLISASSVTAWRLRSARVSDALLRVARLREAFQPAIRCDRPQLVKVAAQHADLGTTLTPLPPDRGGDRPRRGQGNPLPDRARIRLILSQPPRHRQGQGDLRSGRRFASGAHRVLRASEWRSNSPHL
jgi:hypothetical protein